MWWKAYAVLFIVFESFFIGAFFAHQGPRTPMAWMSVLLLTPLAVSGLIARAYGRKIASAKVWKGAFAIYFIGSALNIFESFYVPANRPAGITPRLWTEMAILLAFTIPPGIALLRNALGDETFQRA